MKATTTRLPAQRGFEEAWGSPLITRSDYVEGVKRAVRHRRGYAAWKLGYGERSWLLSPILRAREPDRRKLRAYALTLKHPATSAGLFPPDPDFYGFVPSTQHRYGTSLHLLEDVEERIAERDFDAALIAAGGLGIPLASFVRSRGKVAISLGGALQVLFGVLGERWQSRESWRRRFNDAWIDMTSELRPELAELSGGYW